MDEWIAENCCCGINNQGDWDELLFEEFGCDCADQKAGMAALLNTSSQKESLTHE